MSLKNCETRVKLNTGAELPAVGLGTWQSLENDAYKAVLTALKTGYRHIDGAAIYCNEGEVGKAIRDSGVPRNEIFVTTKLWGTQQRTPQLALEQSLERLGLDYVDLYLIHWPIPLNPAQCEESGNYLTFPGLPNGKRDVDLDTWNFVKTWELMQELPATGKCKAVGVSNFSINNIKELLSSPGNKLVPAVNQIELHPLLPQVELVNFCKEKGIVVEAYSPLGGTGAAILKEPLVEELAKKYNIPAANLVVSWDVQRGVVVLPKSVTESRIISNLQTLTLAPEDVEKITNLSKEKGEKRTCAPDFSPFNTFA
ncbi:hypothetical protein Kpol_1062p29 [Vanderwaltozyma polyspora DSM 70294]|uniref:NADP-dependent oxidoreductase domain-containing protein n=1 Tax=Vanderwaltozyma polyspora (strain ATCC 22028 / DSM 70294 / BCRC 21397 / CBS 2163 / NBRC 10782 / NRRL Y-8283 / UCD 57-17) TaxID=436907 RepID=A7TK86_VANPO|nr:uncharacterized protein Kpol_1062p29 [Vanderwaltozyma polyspora DSM 70294]EDO17321.1 hypothetical protein Kpol_1062p29 [Vanderwaltozyma polyspora DSM 70294]